jgi:hypothetical protein
MHVGEAMLRTIFGVCSGTSVTSSESGKDAGQMLASAMLHHLAWRGFEAAYAHQSSRLLRADLTFGFFSSACVSSHIHVTFVLEYNHIL